MTFDSKEEQNNWTEFVEKKYFSLMTLGLVVS